MPRPSNTEERRGQMVEALMAVMAEHGYDGASVQRIAARAGVPSGVVHYHFADKREILLQLVRSVGAFATERVARALEGKSAPLARVDAFISALLSRRGGAEPSRVAAWIAIGAEAVRDAGVAAEYRAVIDGLIDQLEPLVVDALPRGARRRSRAVAAAIVAAIQGYFVLAAASPAAIPKGSAERSVQRMARGLLSGGVA